MQQPTANTAPHLPLLRNPYAIRQHLYVSPAIPCTGRNLSC